MLKTFKEIKQEITARRAHRECRHDEDGRAVVELTVRDDNDFLSPYSSGTRSVINGDVAEFIEASVMPLNANDLVRLEIYSDEITQDEQKVYTAAIHDYYAEHVEDTLTERRRLLKIAIYMAVVGVLALAIAVTLFALDANEVFTDIVEIFAWVFLWETIDILCFQRSLLRIKQKRYLALADCPIDFLPLGGGDRL
ncbi:MAG: hypothetical protein LUI60_01040 [Clostridia bacterium]|nr:hypothetical protein [Clostridia bacterium]